MLKKYRGGAIGKETLRFIVHKLKRIFPYYFVAWCIGFTVLHTAPVVSFRQILKDLIQSIPAFLQLSVAGFPVYQAIDPAWYISAMLLSMLVLYPLILIWKENFSLIIAPILAIGIYGFLFSKVGSLATINPLEDGFIYTGLMRGIAGICLGCMCFEGAQALSRKSFSLKGKKVLTGMEILCYLAVFAGMNTQGLLRPDLYIVLLLIPAVTLSFSGQSYTSSFKICRWKKGRIRFEEVSLAIFLADYPARELTKKLFPYAQRDERIVPCVLIVVVLATLILLIVPVINRGSEWVIKKTQTTWFVD